MRTTKKLPMALFLLAALCVETGQSAEYELSIDLDDATLSDLDLIGTFLVAATEGQVPSRSMRGVIMSASGEVSIAVSSRIDASGNLLLDDGGAIPLMEEDVVVVTTTTANGSPLKIRILCRLIRRATGVTGVICAGRRIRIVTAGTSLDILIPPGQGVTSSALQ